MNKKEFVLKLTDYSKSNIDWQIEAYNDGTTIGVEAYYLNDGCMLDLHICELFDELELLGLCDEMEGYMSFYGETSIEELKSEIDKLGFITEIC